MVGVRRDNVNSFSSKLRLFRWMAVAESSKSSAVGVDVVDFARESSRTEKGTGRREWMDRSLGKPQLS